MGYRLIDRTAGTNIGNMTASGGLAAAFDGVTSQAFPASAGFQIGGTPWIGKTLAAPAAFGRAIVYGSNNSGFVGGVDPNVTLTFRGKNGAAPATSTDGTAIGTLTFAETADESAGRIVESTNHQTKWDHIIVEITHDGGAANEYCAELSLYAFVPDNMIALFL